jgi:hypothetical protein
MGDDGSSRDDFANEKVVEMQVVEIMAVVGG